MDNLILASLRAIRSLADPGMLRVFILCVLATIGSLTGFVLFGAGTLAWLAALIHHPDIAYGGVLLPVFAWFLFPGIMPLFVSFFANRITTIIEQHEYPATTMHPPAFWPEFFQDLRFFLLTLALNILVLPLYLLPGINVFLFYLLNGYLLGRQFFVMMARRHIPAREADALRKRYGYTVLAAGMLLTLLATIPIINLFAPFWGVAVMVHLYRQFP